METNIKLDNPVWYALLEDQQPFSIDYGSSRFYHPDYCPFGASIHETDIADSISIYSGLVDNFYFVGKRPCLPEDVILDHELVCLQMVADQFISIVADHSIASIDPGMEPLLIDLVNLVQPGFFRRFTGRMGSYYGIWKENQLLAVTGERMRMKGAVEVSAVVTHPEHTGKGYAKQLVAHTTNRILSMNCVPFLHVSATNAGAIALYEKLGYKTRRRMSFWKLMRVF